MSGARDCNLLEPECRELGYCKGHESPRRYHPPARIANHPMIQNAFKVIGAMLIATKGQDLEADFVMYGEGDKHPHQFHIEVTRIDDVRPD